MAAHFFVLLVAEHLRQESHKSVEPLHHASPASIHHSMLPAGAAAAARLTRAHCLFHAATTRSISIPKTSTALSAHAHAGDAFSALAHGSRPY
jgi:hypothetical protein